MCFRPFCCSGLQTFVTAVHSDKSFGEVTQGFVEDTINISNVLILCVTEGSTGHLRKGRGPQNAHHWSEVPYFFFCGEWPRSR
jgi:hypothetical protein